MSAKDQARARQDRKGDAHPFDTDAPSLSRRAIDNGELLSGAYWGEFRTFLAVAKTGSFTRAGAALGASHPTVGRDIKRLQDLMGCQLVVSSHNGVSLTEKGRRLAAQLISLDQTFYSLQNDLRSSDAEGVVRLGVTDGLGAVFVVPELANFSEQYPNLQIHLKSPGNLKHLRENQTDVILGFHPEPSNDVTIKKLGYLHFLPICSTAYTDRYGIPTLSNIRQHQFIDSEMYSAKGVWDPWRKLLSENTVAHFCDASISYGLMIKAGAGIGLGANYNMMEPAARPLDLGVRIRIPMYAVALTDRLQAKPVQIVFKLLERLFGPSNPWFGEEMTLSVNDHSYRAGYAALFNL